MSRMVRLANNVEIPVFGFGCAFGDWSSEKAGKAALRPEHAWDAIPKALSAGLRHFDTAFVYRTHRPLGTSLGMAFRDGSITREDVFVTTKVGHPPVPALFGKTFDWDTMSPEQAAARAKEDVVTSLDELQLGFVDLVLVHWPGNFGSTDKARNRALRSAVWGALEECYELGMTRSIGVSNFTEVHLADLAEDGATVVPHVNQVEISPYTQYTAIIDYCRAHGIILEAFSPLGSSAGGVIKDPAVAALAGKYNKDPGQLVLRWLVQQGIVVLPRSSSARRMASNMDVFDFELAQEDMDALTALNKGTTVTNGNPYEIP